MFRTRYGPWALIAGASDGIGECFSRRIAEAGIHVALLARRESVLKELARDIEETIDVQARVVAADLTSENLTERVEEGVRDLEVGLLVYKAGAVHGAAKFHDRSAAHALALVRLNCSAPVQLVHRRGSPRRSRGRGGILLMTSVAALAGGFYTAIYAATKMFDLVLAEALWHELALGGVDVMGVVAGASRPGAGLELTARGGLGQKGPGCRLRPEARALWCSLCALVGRWLTQKSYGQRGKW